jgi:hypothetical protein
MTGRPPQRILLGLAAVALLAVAFAIGAVILLGGAITAQPPDPFEPDGDPCCGHPDTWGDVWEGIAWVLAATTVDALLVAVAVAAALAAVRGRPPSARPLLLIPAGATILAAVLFAIALLPHRDEARTPPDCDRFAFDRVAWQSYGRAHEDQALGIAHCGLLLGRSPSAVRALLRGAVAGDDGASGHGLVITYRDGRVAAVRAGVDE